MNYVVYAHKVNGTIIYIGSGTMRRARNFSRRTDEWKSDVGANTPEVVILSEHKTRTAALAAEGVAIRAHLPSANLVIPAKGINTVLTVSLTYGMRQRIGELCGRNRSQWVREAIMQRVVREEKKKAKRGGRESK